jgi:hypothetical protein
MEVVSNEFCESFFEDSIDWGKLRSHYGFGGNQRIVVQLFGQLDNTKLHSRHKTPLSFLVQPFVALRFTILASMRTFVFPICLAIYTILALVTPCEI